MRPAALLLACSLMLCLAARSHGQAATGTPLLTDDLCACMAAIDLKGDDRAVSTGVRSCLENAVVRHPGEVLALLDRYPQRGDKAYILGLVLGGALEKGCAPFRAVKARLQQMPGQGALKRPGT